MDTFKAIETTEGFTYYNESILPSNQTIRIEFRETYHNQKYYYDVYLEIVHKKKAKADNFNKITGKDGVISLLWGKQKIKEFEELIKSQTDGKESIIIIVWDDNRRRNVYERGLKNIGYKFEKIFNKKVLCKRI